MSTYVFSRESNFVRPVAETPDKEGTYNGVSKFSNESHNCPTGASQVSLQNNIKPASAPRLHILGCSTHSFYGVVSWKLNGVSLLQKSSFQLFSSRFNFAGMQWNMLFSHENSRLSIFVRQTLRARCVLRLYLLNNRNIIISRKEGLVFFTGQESEPSVYGFSNVITFAELFDSNKSFRDPETDSFRFELHLGLLGNIATQTDDTTAKRNSWLSDLNPKQLNSVIKSLLDKYPMPSPPKEILGSSGNSSVITDLPIKSDAKAKKGTGLLFNL